MIATAAASPSLSQCPASAAPIAGTSGSADVRTAGLRLCETPASERRPSSTTTSQPICISQCAVMIARVPVSSTSTRRAPRVPTQRSIACTSCPPSAETDPGRCPARVFLRGADVEQIGRPRPALAEPGVERRAVDAPDAEAPGDIVGEPPRRLGRRLADRRQRRPGIALQLQPGEPPGLRPALQRDDPVRHAGVDQRLRADDAAGAAGAGDDDQRIRVGHQIGEAMHQLGAGAAHRAGHMKAVELLDRAAVEHRDLRALAPDTVEFGGGDVRRVPVDLDDLGEGLARHVGARKQLVPFSLPLRHAARDDMHGGIAEARQPPRRLFGDPVAAVDQHDPARAPRHQPADIEFEPAIRQVDGEQRVPGAVLTLLAHVEKRDLAAIAEPVPHGCDIDLGGIRHIRFLPAKTRSDAPDAACLPPVAHEAAGAGAGVLAVLEDRRAGDQGRAIAVDPLHQTPAAGRQIVHDLGLMQAQPVEIDQVDIGAQARPRAGRGRGSRRNRRSRWSAS